MDLQICNLKFWTNIYTKNTKGICFMNLKWNKKNFLIKNCTRTTETGLYELKHLARLLGCPMFNFLLKNVTKF